MVANFAIGLDILKVVAETDPEACVKYEVMEQIDRFAWNMDNTYGVQSSLSLPQVAKTVNSAFSEANPRFKVLPRNQSTIVQAITPIPTSSGLLNPNCSAMAVFVFMKDHKATTIQRVVDKTKDFNRTNAETFFETHTDVDAAYCPDKLAARRAVGTTRHEAQKLVDKIKKRNPEITETELNETPSVIQARAREEQADTTLAGSGTCSSISRQVTTSKEAGDSSANASAVTFL